MSKPTREDASGLIVAATSLEDALVEFEQVAGSLDRLPLASERNLQKAGKLLAQVAALQERLGLQAQALMGAINAARSRQERQAELVQARATAVQERAQTYESLLNRYAALGESAGAINAEMLDVAGKPAVAGAPEPPDFQGRLERVEVRLTELARDAEALSKLAAAEQFSELSRHADALRQQLSTAKGKLIQLQRRTRAAS